MMSRTYTLVILSAASLALTSCGEDSSSQSPYDIDDQDNSKAPAPEELGVNPQYISYCEATSDYGDDGTIDAVATNTFDEQGRLIESLSTARDNQYITHVNYTYNNEGQLIKAYRKITTALDNEEPTTQHYGIEYTFIDKQISQCKTYFAFKDPVYIATKDYTYDSTGRLETISTNDNQPTTNQQSYSPKEIQIEQLRPQTNSSPTRFIFNEQGRLTDVNAVIANEDKNLYHLEWTPSGKVSYFRGLREDVIFKYDHNQNMVQKTSYDLDTKKVRLHLEAKYDEHNNITQFKQNGYFGRPASYKITRHNNTISIYEENSNTETDLSTYDKHGNLISHLTISLPDSNGKQSKSRSTFNYDCFKGKAAPKPLPRYNYNRFTLHQKDYETPQCQIDNISHHFAFMPSAEIQSTGKLHYFKTQLEF